MIETPKIFNDSRDMTTPLWRTCYPWARTCYDHPIYQIWSLYLHPLRRKIWKAIHNVENGGDLG